jgi:hypothetical protein
MHRRFVPNSRRNSRGLCGGRPPVSPACARLAQIEARLAQIEANLAAARTKDGKQPKEKLSVEDKLESVGRTPAFLRWEAKYEAKHTQAELEQMPTAIMWILGLTTAQALWWWMRETVTLSGCVNVVHEGDHFDWDWDI